MSRENILLAVNCHQFNPKIKLHSFRDYNYKLTVFFVFCNRML
jgi:hypothetical protein